MVLINQVKVNEKINYQEMCNNKKILIIEDDNLVLKMLQFILKKEGYQLVIAKDGQNAIDRLPLITPDLIITDIIMPYKSGLDVISHVKSISPNTPIIVISALGKEKLTVKEAFRLGADDFIAKPFNASEVVARVKRLLINSHFGIITEVNPSNLFIENKNEIGYKSIGVMPDISKLFQNEAGLDEITLMDSEISEKKKKKKKEKKEKTIEQPNEINAIPQKKKASLFDGDIKSKYVLKGFKENDFMIKVSDASMSPNYNNGDVLICKEIKEKNKFQWGKAYVINHNTQGIILRRLLPSNKIDTIKCKSDNPIFPDFKIKMTDIITLGAVIGSIRKE